MSMKVFDKEVTRREFMRLMGKGTACIAASTPLMQLFGATKAEAEAGAVSVYATAQGVLVSNAARCTGCGREVMLPRAKIEKNIKKVIKPGSAQ